ncbi:MAG: helix-turn-helix domain-containing protein, partial [Proteobacteria bacterium]|nr:helix-turn-helix domain-containing protein [Pseudomonadota bacterium]
MDLIRHDILRDGAAEAEGPEGAQSVGRALRLLRLLGTAGQSGVSLAWLVARSGLSKPTCRRLLVALMAEGMVEQDEESRGYFLGREA